MSNFVVRPMMAFVRYSMGLEYSGPLVFWSPSDHQWVGLAPPNIVRLNTDVNFYAPVQCNLDYPDLLYPEP